MLISSSSDSIKNWSLYLSIQLKPQIKFGFLKIKKSTIVLKMHEDVVSKVRKYLTRWNFEDCKTRDQSNSFKFRQTLAPNNFCQNHTKKYDDL